MGQSIVKECDFDRALSAFGDTEPFQTFQKADFVKHPVKFVGSNKTAALFQILLLQSDPNNNFAFIFTSKNVLSQFETCFGKNEKYYYGLSFFTLGDHSVHGLRPLHHEAGFLDPETIFRGNAAGFCTTPSDYVYLTKQMPGQHKDRVYNVGDTENMKQLESALLSVGFEKVDRVENPNEYAVRGGIVDLYPNYSNHPVRFEFNGDKIESIRLFSLVDQRSINHLESYSLLIGFYDNQQKFPFNHIPVIVDCDDWSLTINKNAGGQAEHISLNITEPPKSISKEFFNQSKIKITDVQLDASFPSFIVDNSLLVKNHGLDSDPVYHSSEFTNYRKIRREGFLESLIVGDLVLHKNHGHGIFEGLETIKTKSGKFAENLKIKYKDGGVVFVPIDNLKSVFPSTLNSSTKIDSLKSSSWRRRVVSAESGAQDLARTLINLYSIRKKPKGRTYNTDDDFDNIVSASFPHQLTDGQKSAIDDIKSDLQSSHPMNRLLVGDVGFGKTEVMLRAAVLCITSGYQVIILTPTTLLADQHYFLFKSRLDKIGVRVGLLSRFATPKKRAAAVEEFLQQKIEILIGTHGVLSANILSKTVGLVIIDEEHRFGTKQKDKLLLDHPLIDFLTVSATPLPRTLQKSLEGYLPASTLPNPPPGRLPIKTEIKYFDYDWVARAIIKELASGGQVIIIQNSIRNLPEIKREVEKLVAGAEVDVIHGNLSSKSLENAFLRFFSGETNVVCGTTIVESGLDIPNVKTIIICDAHKYGLSQLHQLRGRVGRSAKQSHCYLSIPKNTKLSPAAYLRLRSINENCYLGSGFSVAQKDLEIRGPGDIFGSKQSGHIKNVGYPIFLELLDKALGSSASPDVVVEVDAPRLIPNSYIPDDTTRLGFYSRISDAETKKDILSIKLDLNDRFGKYPSEVDLMLRSKKAHLAARGGPISMAAIDSNNLRLTCDKKLIHKIIKQIESTNVDCELVDVANQNITVFLKNSSVKKNICFFTELVEHLAE